MLNLLFDLLVACGRVYLFQVKWLGYIGPGRRRSGCEEAIREDSELFESQTYVRILIREWGPYLNDARKTFSTQLP